VLTTGPRLLALGQEKAYCWRKYFA